MSPVEALTLHSSIVPVIKIVKVNDEDLIADILTDNIENTMVVTIGDDESDY
jgi:hypothetical protein